MCLFLPHWLNCCANFDRRQMEDSSGSNETESSEAVVWARRTTCSWLILGFKIRKKRHRRKHLRRGWRSIADLRGPRLPIHGRSRSRCSVARSRRPPGGEITFCWAKQASFLMDTVMPHPCPTGHAFRSEVTPSSSRIRSSRIESNVSRQIDLAQFETTTSDSHSSQRVMLSVRSALVELSDGSRRGDHAAQMNSALGAEAFQPRRRPSPLRIGCWLLVASQWVGLNPTQPASERGNIDRGCPTSFWHAHPVSLVNPPLLLCLPVLGRTHSSLETGLHPRGPPRPAWSVRCCHQLRRPLLPSPAALLALCSSLLLPVPALLSAPETELTHAAPRPCGPSAVVTGLLACPLLLPLSSCLCLCCPKRCGTREAPRPRCPHAVATGALPLLSAASCLPLCPSALLCCGCAARSSALSVCVPLLAPHATSFVPPCCSRFAPFACYATTPTRSPSPATVPIQHWPRVTERVESSTSQG